jgi:hypothetical protein
LTFGVGVNITIWSYVDRCDADAFALIRQAAGTPAKVPP